MSDQTSHREDVDLDREEVRDSQGRRITEDYIEAAVAEVESEDLALDEDRAHFPGRGRPSLSGQAGSSSPRVGTRVHPEVKRRLERLARVQHRNESEVLREALDEYLARH